MRSEIVCTTFADNALFYCFIPALRRQEKITCEIFSQKCPKTDHFRELSNRGKNKTSSQPKANTYTLRTEAAGVYGLITALRRQEKITFKFFTAKCPKSTHFRELSSRGKNRAFSPLKTSYGKGVS